MHILKKTASIDDIKHHVEHVQQTQVLVNSRGGGLLENLENIAIRIIYMYVNRALETCQN